MKKIYLNKEDMRSYALSSDVAWETIELDVPDDFEGGDKYYDLVLQKWVDDGVQKISQDEIIAFEKKLRVLNKQRKLEFIELQITRLERIKQRTELEEQELDQLIDQSTNLYRAIKELEEEQNDESN